jgi:choline dehydrogenase-like flavoprotein
MGSDPRTSVVDANCRIHGVDNLYVAGGAVFPTSSQANPTLTIVALAVRLAAHLRSLQAR